MNDDLSSLPLKSMQLPTRTVGKLKPLGLATIRDLYAISVARLIELGLVLRELEEIAEAAPDFGVTWSSKADVKAAFDAVPAAVVVSVPAAQAKTQKAEKPDKKKPAANLPRGALPADFEAALAAGPEAIGLTTSDVDELAPYVDDSGRHFKTSPPSARHLRVFRRLRLVRGPSIGGADRWYVVAVIDVTQVPRARIGDLTTISVDLANLMADVLKRAGIDVLSQQVSGAATFAVAARSRPKTERLIEAHRARFDAAPVHGSPVSDDLVVFAADGLNAAGLHADTIALAPQLASVAGGLADTAAIEALRNLATAFLATNRAADGTRILEPLLHPRALARATQGSATATALLAAARLFVGANAHALAVDVIARAVAVDPTTRGEILDEALFDALHDNRAFSSLYRGFPAFEARLGTTRSDL